MKVATDSRARAHSRRSRAGVAGLVGRSAHGARRRPRLDGALRRRPGRFGPTGRAGRGRRARRAACRASITPPEGNADGRPSPSPSRSTTSSTCATTPSASSATSASRPAAVDAQNTFAIAVAGRGFDARISTECDVRLPDVRLRLLRQLHRRLPHRRADVQERARHAAAGTWDESPQTVTDTICPYCGVGCTLDAPRPGQRHRQGHLAARPLRDERPPLHQGPLRLAVRPGAPAGRIAPGTCTWPTLIRTTS